MAQINRFSELTQSTWVVVIKEGDGAYLAPSHKCTGIPYNLLWAVLIPRPGRGMTAEPITPDPYIEYGRRLGAGWCSPEDKWKCWVVSDGRDTVVVLANENWGCRNPV